MTDEKTIQNPRLKEIAKAAAEISTISSEEAFEAIVEGIIKVPEQFQMMIDTIVAIQFEWPMPEEGWKRFVEDVERTNKRLGLDLHVDPPDSLDPLNNADIDGDDWVSVEDMLPFRDGLYLVYSPSANPEKPFIGKARFNPRNDLGWDFDVVKTWLAASVTHWMPLPEPPA